MYHLCGLVFPGQGWVPQSNGSSQVGLFLSSYVLVVLGKYQHLRLLIQG